MILDGVEKIDKNKSMTKNVFLFSQQAAKALIEELKYSVEESLDHGFLFPITIRVNDDETLELLIDSK